MRTGHAKNGSAGQARSQSSRQAAVPLSLLLDRWVAQRIITPEQAARMTGSPGLPVYVDADEHPGRVQRSPLVVEALGYLGGAIVVAASMLIAARYWGDLTSTWRLTLLGCAALILLVCGATVLPRRSDVVDRLRAVLWLGSTAACAGCLAVLAVDFLDLRDNDMALLVAAGTAVYAVGLWISSRTLVQQFAMMVALAVAASAAAAETGVSDLPGLGAWAVGVIWALWAWRGVLEPTRFGLTLGSAMAILGAMLTAGSDAGTVLTLATVATVVAAATAFRDLLLLGVGTVGLLLNLPMAMTRWFPDSPAVPYALLVVGGLLVVAAVSVARRRTSDEHGTAPDSEDTAHSTAVPAEDGAGGPLVPRDT